MTKSHDLSDEPFIVLYITTRVLFTSTEVSASGKRSFDVCLKEPFRHVGGSFKVVAMSVVSKKTDVIIAISHLHIVHHIAPRAGGEQRGISKEMINGALVAISPVIAPIIWSYMEGATFLKDRTRFIQIFSPYGSLKIYNDTNF